MRYNIINFSDQNVFNPKWQQKNKNLRSLYAGFPVKSLKCHHLFLTDSMSHISLENNVNLWAWNVLYNLFTVQAQGFVCQFFTVFLWNSDFTTGPMWPFDVVFLNLDPIHWEWNWEKWWSKPHTQGISCGFENTAWVRFTGNVEVKIKLD